MAKRTDELSSFTFISLVWGLILSGCITAFAGPSGAIVRGAVVDQTRFPVAALVGLDDWMVVTNSDGSF